MTQYVIDGIATACAILPVAIGFFLIYRTLGVLHFAHGAMATLGAYLFFALKVGAAVPVALAIPITAAALGAIGWATELFLYGALRTRRANTLAGFIASLGLYTVTVSVLALIFGDGTRSVEVWRAAEGIFILGARISVARLTTIGVGFAAFLISWAALAQTRFGRQLEAVASDAELAAAVGVSLRTVYAAAMAAGTLMAGITGLLLSLDVGASPTMGLSPLLSGVVAVFIGGRSVVGVACGALIIGLAQHLGVLWLAIKWQDAILYVILVLFLLIRPGGVSGMPAREGSF